MIDANANGRLMLFTDVQEWNKAISDLLEFGRILLIRVFLQVECLDSIYIVARIDPDLLDLLGCHIGCTGIEVNIGH